MNLGEAAAAFRAIAERAESGLAREACEEAARDYLAVLRMVTPKRSGRLAESERIDSVTGGGTFAVAVVAPHTRYAAFRNYGGTITRHKPGSLGTPAVGFFGHSVTQAGSHYMERAEGAAAGPVSAACRAVAGRYFTL
ncbi:MAG TPA: HK97 gp10 family phage protein [Streptosporangiaceae bacterium]|nr:HK97 gp10 family phage protein [Streptosporangiaceae bacterium]